MYVSFDDFKRFSMSGMDEEEYMRIAPFADAIIDDWTLQRAGRAVRNGEDLPDIVKSCYSLTVENLPSIMEDMKGEQLSSFSNGIDSYTFNVTSKVKERLSDAMGWAVDMLPLEWMSGVVSFEGGNRYAG